MPKLDSDRATTVGPVMKLYSECPIPGSDNEDEVRPRRQSPVTIDEAHHDMVQPNSSSKENQASDTSLIGADPSESSCLLAKRQLDYDPTEGSIIRTVWALVNVVFWLVICGTGVLGCLLMIPFLGLTRVQRLTWRIACIFFRISLWASGVAYTVEGLENLDPNGNYFFACNHTSDYDIPLLFAVVPCWLISIAKSSISYIPIFGWAVALGGTIFIQRSNHKKALQSLDDGCKALRKRPRSVLLFPEGTRSEDGEVKQFKKGGLLLAIQSGIPVVPVAVCGARRVMGRALGWRPMTSAHCAVVMGRPVPTAGLTYEDRDEFCAALQREVARLKDEWEYGAAAAAVVAGQTVAVEPLWHCFLPAPPADQAGWWGRVMRPQKQENVQTRGGM